MARHVCTRFCRPFWKKPVNAKVWVCKDRAGNLQARSQNASNSNLFPNSALKDSSSVCARVFCPQGMLSGIQRHNIWYKDGRYQDSSSNYQGSDHSG
eukprot:2112523-Amphidinium_carterae.1